MGNFLEKPKTEKQSSNGCKQGLTYQLSHMQGWRLEMEDAHTHILEMPAPFNKWSFFAVFDGHAGAQVANIAGEKLLEHILKQDYLKDIDASVVSDNSYDNDKVIDAIQKGFLSLDADLKEKDVPSGSTATALLITPLHFFFINAGDSRSLLIRKDTTATQPNHKYNLHPTYQKAIEDGHFGETTKIASRNGQLSTNDDNSSDAKGDASTISTGNSKAEMTESDKYYCYYSTTDHKPFDDEEKRRIEAAGGMVIIQRINGALAVSRALGDFDYKRNPEKEAKDQQVSPFPVVEVLDRNPELDSYAVLACDGIYDAITNENLVKYLNYKMLCGEPLDQVTKGCLDLCLSLGSRDNMSLCLVNLGQAPTVDEDMKSREEKINQDIVKFMEDEINQNEQYSSVLTFNQPHEKLFFDLYQDGHLKRLCGENYIYSTSSTPQSNQPATSYTGGVVDKHRLIRKHVEKMLEKKAAKE